MSCGGSGDGADGCVEGDCGGDDYCGSRGAVSYCLRTLCNRVRGSGVDG